MAWSLLELPGLWQRSGMDGRPVGFDVASALRLPSAVGADAECVEALLRAGEAGALIGLAARDRDAGG